MSKTFSTSRTAAALVAVPRPVHPQSENFRRRFWELHAQTASVANAVNLTDERFKHALAVLASKRISRVLNKPGHVDKVKHAKAGSAWTPAGLKK